jgi:hypothetical protein
MPEAQAAPGDTPVAVVDLIRCVREHPGYAAARARFQASEKAATDKRDAAVKDFKEQQGKLQLEPPDAPGFLDKQRTLEKIAASIKIDFEYANRGAADEMMRALTSVYENVRATVATYARNNRILLVVQMTEEKLQAKSPDEFTANVVVRSAIHWEPTLDITAAIVQQVKASAPPGPGK